MRNALLVSILLLTTSCHEAAKDPPDARPTVTPAGLASAVKLVSSSNAVEVLATLRHPTELALTGEAIFVLDSEDFGLATDRFEDIVRLPRAVGGAPKTIFTRQEGASGLAVAGDHLTWTIANSEGKDNVGARIVSAKASGGVLATMALTYPLDDVTSVSDGTRVFGFSNAKEGKGAIVGVALSGKPVDVAPLGPKPVRSAIAVNATHVFWVQSDALMRAPKEGGEPTVIAKLTSSSVKKMVADDASVYWTDHGRGDPTWTSRVYQASIATGAITPISDVARPIGIALDGDTVYWASVADGRILARKKAGGPTYVLARDQRAPVGLAVDATHVYWTNDNDGTVCRTDKVPQMSP